MTCPECGIDRTECVKTATMGSVTLRWRRCLCGVEFRTEETFVPKSVRLPVVTGNHRQPPATPGNRGQPPATAGNPPQLGGGVGGGVPSGLGSGSDPIPPSVPSQQSGARARVKAPKPTLPLFLSPEFVRFWAAYPRKTGKGKAWEEWQKQNPGVDQVLAALAWQCKQFDWTKEGGKYVPMPATWLHQVRWEDEPPTRARPPASPPPREAPGAGDLRRWATDLRAERKPSDDTLTPPDWMGLDEKLAAAKGTG